MDIIEREFDKRAIRREGIYLFDSHGALDVIKRCHDLKKRILGIDSFRITENTTQPVLEYSIDFSIRMDAKDIWKEAENFIMNNDNKGLVFEVVYE